MYLTIQTVVGRLTIKCNGDAVTNIYFEDEAPASITQSPECPVLQNAATQLQEYFAGQRRVFDVPIAPIGTKFLQSIWQTMAKDLVYGTITTYGELGPARAVGNANNKNPIPIIIPCHRVVGKNGKLTGFRWGLPVKEKLLALESDDKHG